MKPVSTFLLLVFLSACSSVIRTDQDRYLEVILSNPESNPSGEFGFSQPIRLEFEIKNTADKPVMTLLEPHVISECASAAFPPGMAARVRDSSGVVLTRSEILSFGGEPNEWWTFGHLESSSMPVGQRIKRTVLPPGRAVRCTVRLDRLLLGAPEIEGDLAPGSYNVELRWYSYASPAHTIEIAAGTSASVPDQTRMTKPLRRQGESAGESLRLKPSEFSDLEVLQRNGRTGTDDS
jgi:hypothetical protein